MHPFLVMPARFDEVKNQFVLLQSTGYTLEKTRSTLRNNFPKSRDFYVQKQLATSHFLVKFVKKVTAVKTVILLGQKSSQKIHDLR